MKDINALADLLDLTTEGREVQRTAIMKVYRASYLAGSKNGCEWTRKQIAKENLLK